MKLMPGRGTDRAQLGELANEYIEDAVKVDDSQRQSVLGTSFMNDLPKLFNNTYSPTVQISEPSVPMSEVKSEGKVRTEAEVPQPTDA
jgi:hypothetical protein